MAKRRISMRKIKEVLRLKWEHSFSNRKIAHSCSLSHSTVREYVLRAKLAGLSWPLPAEFDDGTLENLLFPPAKPVSPDQWQMPDMEYVHQELKRKSVTLQLLWYEYKEANPEGYQYSRFCELYRKWQGNVDVCLRQHHRAGERLFIDYAGQTVAIHDATNGDVREAHLFVATLGASNYTFAEATLSLDLPSWIKLHVHAFEFFGGVAEILVPDNVKTGVTHPCRYEPDLNPTYQDMARHYGTCVIPARAGKPKDKAKVETAVLCAERWILAALRNHKFFSLAELNRPSRKNSPTSTTASSTSWTPRAQSCLRPWIGRLSKGFRFALLSMPNGKRPRSISIIISKLTATSTVCLFNSSNSMSTYG